MCVCVRRREHSDHLHDPDQHPRGLPNPVGLEVQVVPDLHRHRNSPYEFTLGRKTLFQALKRTTKSLCSE